MNSISNMNKPITEPCPNCSEENVIEKFISTAPAIVDPFVAGRIRLNSDMKYRLNEIKKAHPDNRGSTSTTDDAFSSALE